MHGCEIRSESTRTIADRSGLHPDILITADDRAPVVIEAEFMPAPEVERDAEERLRLEVTGGRREIEAAIALRYPAGLEDAYDLDAELAHAQLSYCVLTTPEEDGADFERFPESGWLQGSAGDVAELARLVSVPQSTVNAAASALETGIESAVGVLNSMERLAPVAAREIADLLGMSDVPQTRRMACAIMANAMVFHDRIADLHSEILPLSRLWREDADNPQGRVSEAWDRILEINYWPIFAVARDIVNLLPSLAAARILEHLRTTAHRIRSTGANVAHDLTGRVFQRLIVDRKYLATFYTLPASAALLARLAVDKLEGVDWSDANAIGMLRVGDFACGTGALLSAVYEQFATRHEQVGGAPASLHKAMMEDVLYGCDVMPSAIHITSSTLSGREPNVGFGGSRLYNMPYGRQSDGTVAIGSLELLQSSAVMTLFNTNDPAMRTGSTGEETAARVIVDVRDESFDIVIINPPFTSNTKHRDADDGVLNAAFAAFDASRTDQKSMADRVKRLDGNGCYDGNAGLGSAFATLADRKIRPGGVVAFVLPITVINGVSWTKFRRIIATRYTKVMIVSISAHPKDMSFSSDTGMAECLVIGRKLRRNERADLRANFVSLRRRPEGFVQAGDLSKSILIDTPIRKIEDGPFGGVSVYCGATLEGEQLEVPIAADGNGWSAARISDMSLAQTAYSLSIGELWLPAASGSIELPTARLNQIGKRGYDSQAFINPAQNGPFSRAPANPSATYPSLWNHKAQNERMMVCQADSSLTVKIGLEAEAANLWATASRAHISRGFRFNSQSLAVAFTERESIGGRAWPNVTFDDERFDFVFTVWGNSTLGLLLYWWNSNLQQGGRGDMTVRTMENLPVLDFRTLSGEQLATAKAIFDEFRALDLKPAYLADADPNRALLDKRVVCDLLGFGEDIYQAVRLLAAKWCAEPSVHGGKKRPRGAKLVV